MELGLRLGGTPKQRGEKPRESVATMDLDFCMALSIGPVNQEAGNEDDGQEGEGEDRSTQKRKRDSESEEEKPIQLIDLLPYTPVPRKPPNSSHNLLPWPASENGSSDGGSSVRDLDVNRTPAAVGETEDGGASPTSAVSSFRMEFGLRDNRGANGNLGGGTWRPDVSNAGGGNEAAGESERASCRGSDEDENGYTRKKLRLSKEQSAFLEESFKEHNTLNPKQKMALAKQLNLRPRQVEVWFQNRRARTKLKQTEVDCEYLKRCCETLTEENRRLQKELQELRVLKTTSSFYMQLPATTLTMCPSCERVATTATANCGAAEPGSKASRFSLAKPKPAFPLFAQHQTDPHKPKAS